MKILLHTCCGPCLTGTIEQLKPQDLLNSNLDGAQEPKRKQARFLTEHEIVLFFSNSNIYPEEEYEKRLENAKKVSEIYKMPLITGKYVHEDWLEFIKGLEQEPESGRRCLKCFEFNLTQAAKKAKELRIENFTTTLTISPYKNSNNIFEVGKQVAKQHNLNFIEYDFKDNEGYKKSIELSKKYNLYRQKYCGCEFSLKQRVKHA